MFLHPTLCNESNTHTDRAGRRAGAGLGIYLAPATGHGSARCARRASDWPAKCARAWAIAPNRPRAGAFAPNFALKTLDDKTLLLSDLKGKVVIVNFWATWCPPCRAEMPALQAAQAEHEAQGLVVVGVNQLEDVSLVKAFQQASNYSLNFVLDSDGKTARAYNVAGLPTSFFINREGVIEHAEYGGAMTRALIESKLAPMLSQ